MNKYLILLGLVLIASLSFAKGGPDNWMQSVQGKYSCNALYIEHLYGLAHDYKMGTIDQRNALLTYGSGSYGRVYGPMYAYAGCGGSEDLSSFHSQMISYNSEVSSFNQIFTSVLKGYLTSHPGDISDIRTFLSNEMSSYRECIASNPFCVEGGA